MQIKNIFASSLTLQMFKLFRIFSILSIAALSSCSDGDNSFVAYFGGEVTNPQVRYVIFSRGNTVIDTIPLDKDNRFFIKFDSLTPGMYNFKHDPDYQYVYFDKNDSIMVSINTVNFDKSIMFSGRGEKKNNFMMDLSLMNEADRQTSSVLYDRAFAGFSKGIDSVNSLRQAFYAKSKREIGWSNGFDFYAKTRVDFNYFTKKEYYPYVHFRRTGNLANNLPADFYDFRKKINFNDSKLTNFSPFVRYFTAMLNNMAISRGINKGGGENSLRDNIAKLNIADSIFTNEKIRNEVLNNIAFSYLLQDQDMVSNQKFLQEYLKLSTDKSDNNQIRKIGEAINFLKPGSKLPEISLVNAENKPFDIKSVNKETVFYFWTSCAKTHYEMTGEKIAALKKQFPNVDFIGVNVDDANEWKISMAKLKPADIQLRASDFEALKEKWVFTKINRTIILNADGTIKNAFTSLLDTDFNTLLATR